MHLEIIRTIDDLNGMAEEWNELLAVSASHVPFLRHEYISTWWSTLGGGEWSHGELYVVIARDGDGNLIGIAPLFYTSNRDGKAALMLIGSVEISDYLDVIARPQDLSSFLDEVLAHLDGPKAPPWQCLDWYNVLDSSLTLPALKTAVDQRGWTYSQEHYDHCPYIPLPGDWDEYLAGINKKQRHEIRRKMRRAANYEEPVHWYFVEDEADLETEIDSFLQLMAYDAQKQAFLTDVMQEQMRRIIKAAHRGKWLQLAFLEIGGEKAAGYLNFDFGNRIWVYNSGIDFGFGSLSPGWVLLGHLLKWANENGREAFDFLRGDEAYKYRFGGVDRFVLRVQVNR